MAILADPSITVLACPQYRRGVKATGWYPQHPPLYLDHSATIIIRC